MASLRDSRYVRCRHCGFICHRDRDMRGSGRMGDGVKSVSNVTVTL
jgi:hypothetical protein